jgi:hypothetical protein
VRSDPLEQALRRCLAVRARDRLPSAVEAAALLCALDGVTPPPPSAAAPSRPSFSPGSAGSPAVFGPPDTIPDAPAFRVPPEPAPPAATVFGPPAAVSTAPPAATVMAPAFGGLQPGYQAGPRSAARELAPFAPRAAAPLVAPSQAPKKRSILMYLLAFVVIGLGAVAVAILALFAFVMLHLAR